MLVMNGKPGVDEPHDDCLQVDVVVEGILNRHSVLLTCTLRPHGAHNVLIIEALATRRRSL